MWLSECLLISPQIISRTAAKAVLAARTEAEVFKQFREARVIIIVKGKAATKLLNNIINIDVIEIFGTPFPIKALKSTKAPALVVVCSAPVSVKAFSLLLVSKSFVGCQ